MPDVSQNLNVEYYTKRNELIRGIFDEGILQWVLYKFDELNARDYKIDEAYEIVLRRAEQEFGEDYRV